MVSTGDWRELREIQDLLVPLLVVEQQIYQHTMYRPNAVMLPLSVGREADTWRGLHVVRGDRAGLIYEGRPL